MILVFQQSKISSPFPLSSLNSFFSTPSSLFQHDQKAVKHQEIISLCVNGFGQVSALVCNQSQNKKKGLSDAEYSLLIWPTHSKTSVWIDLKDQESLHRLSVDCSSSQAIRLIPHKGMNSFSVFQTISAVSLQWKKYDAFGNLLFEKLCTHSEAFSLPSVQFLGVDSESSLLMYCSVSQDMLVLDLRYGTEIMKILNAEPLRLNLKGSHVHFLLSSPAPGHLLFFSINSDHQSKSPVSLVALNSLLLPLLNVSAHNTNLYQALHTEIAENIGMSHAKKSVSSVAIVSSFSAANQEEIKHNILKFYQKIFFEEYNPLVKKNEKGQTSEMEPSEKQRHKKQKLLDKKQFKQFYVTLDEILVQVRLLSSNFL
jgi:hypothetical protein